MSTIRGSIRDVQCAEIEMMMIDTTLLAQTVTDPDVLGQIQRAVQHFISSGQVWALIIGFIIGYGFKGMMPG